MTSTTAFITSRRPLSSRRPRITSWDLGRGCRAALSRASSLKNGCDRPLLAEGRCEACVVSSMETRALPRSLTHQASAGMNAQRPERIFFRRAAWPSASKGQWPLSRAKVMAPTAHMSQEASAGPGSGTPASCSGARQWMHCTQEGAAFESHRSKPTLQPVSLRDGSAPPLTRLSTRMFPGWTSSCTTPAACRCCRPVRIWRTRCARVNSVSRRGPSVATAKKSSLPGASSKICQRNLGSSR
mmetsp:Transcript_57197/g.167937  ORF Transcript_57197/g.167937 Transcript_57197/m.167937 type:complete len:242 (+) Transcript_57197:138-863(+)